MSYRSYNSWKYNPSSYTPSSSRSYGLGSSSGRDDGGSSAATSGNSDTKAPRFCSINPSTYRPTFSGGTYRTSASTAGSTGTTTASAKKPELVVGSRYLTATKDTAKQVTVTPSVEKKAPSKLESYMSRRNAESSTLNKYGSSKELQSTGETKRTPSRYSSSSTNNLTSIGTEGRSSQRNLSSTNLSDSDKSKTSKYPSSRDLRKDSGDAGKTSSSRFSPNVTAKNESTSSRYGSASKLSSSADKEKDSPSNRYGGLYPSSYAKKAAEEKTAAKKNDHPPITYNTLYARSADKKPTITINRTRSRDPSPLKNRSRDQSPIEQVKDRYGSTTSGFTGANSYTNRFRNAVSPINQRPAASASGSLLSYMTSSEAAAVTRKYSRSRSKEPQTVDQTLEEIKHLAADIDRVLNVEVEEVVMVQVNVIHRATSPNPASTTPTRARRLDISKTVTKTIERPLKKPEMVDKEIQSDRMDDPTKYSRFNPTSSRATSSTWSPSESKKSVSVGKNRTESPDAAKSSSLTKSNSIKNLSLSDSKKSLSRSDSVKKSNGSSKSGKSEKSLPPTAPPKGDSPGKTINATTTNGGTVSLNVNKDFRKSALNMGPTDRLRRGRGSTDSSSSKSSSSAIVCNHHSRSERSQSVGSETGSTCSSAPSSARQTPDPQRNKTLSAKVPAKPHKQLSSQKNSKTSSATASSMEEEEELPSIDNLSDICVTVTQNAKSSTTTTAADAPSLGGGVGASSPNESGAKNEINKDQHHVAELNVVGGRSPSQFESQATTATTTTSNNLGLSTVAKIFYRSVSPQLRPHPSLPAAIFVPDRDTPDLEPNTTATSLRNRCDSTSASESLKLDTEPVLANGKLTMGVRGCSELSSERSWFAKGHADQPLELKTELLGKVRHIDSEDRSTWGSNRQNGGSAQQQQVASESAENGGCENTNDTNIASAYKIRHIESGECAWWMTNGSSSRNSPSGSACSAEKTNQLTVNGNGSASEEKGDASRYKIRHVQSGEKAWWLSPTPEVNTNSGAAGVANGGEASKYKLRHIESGEKAWWMKSDQSDPVKERSASVKDEQSVKSSKYIIRPVESGERAWWMDGPSESSGKKGNKTEDDISEVEEDEEFEQIVIDGTLGDRASPEGVEDPLVSSLHRHSPYENMESAAVQELQKKAATLFISKHTNIDDVLGSSTLQQARENLLWKCDSGPRSAGKPRPQSNSRMLDDATLQIYKDGDYGVYLDLESSLAEQSEEIEGLQGSRKNSLVVRTQLTMRVQAIIEKLLTTTGQDLRRTLSSLKQIFQEDKDLVHGFVAEGGLDCLVRVGSEADQNYQNYILRALGQVMLYVDGMNGVMKHGPTVQWLYSLIASKYRLLLKTALKLLLVFVEYAESNSFLLVQAIQIVDCGKGELPWSNIMRLLKDSENSDTELLIYATTLINKTLSGLSDQDSFYDESDYLEQQGMEGVIQRFMSRPGTDLELLDQLQLYEDVLKFEDGESDGVRIPENTRTMRHRTSLSSDAPERRKSRRHSTGTTPPPPPLPKSIPPPPPPSLSAYMSNYHHPKMSHLPQSVICEMDAAEDSSSSQNSTDVNGGVFRECRDTVSAVQPREGAGVTPGLRRRRERAERQKSFMREQQDASGYRFGNSSNSNSGVPDESEHVAAPKTVPPPTPPALVDDSRVLNGRLLKTLSISSPPISSLSSSSSTSSPPKHLMSSLKITTTNLLPNKPMLDELPYDQSGLLLTTAKPLIKSSRDSTPSSPYTSGGLCDRPAKRPTKLFDTDLTPSNSRFSEFYNQFPLKSTATNESHVLESAKLNLIQRELNPYPSRKSMHISMIPSSSSSSCSSSSLSTLSSLSTISTPPLSPSETLSSQDSDTNEDKKLLLQLKRDHTVKDLTQKLNNLPMCPPEDKLTALNTNGSAGGNNNGLPQSLIGDMTGLISKAKEGLAKSKSKGDVTRSPSYDPELKKQLSPEPKKSENELHWEELVRNMARPLNLCDLDFTDLTADDEKDVLAPRGLGGNIPPPPPPLGMPAAPPPSMMRSNVIPPPMFPPVAPSGLFNLSGKSQVDSSLSTATSTIQKSKKTVKLFWKEVREDLIPVTVGQTIWDELPTANVDTEKLEHLFESRAKDIMTKKQQEMNKNKEIIVLDHKRSNAINIAMTKLPPPRAIKAAILKMDATVVTREGIDKLLNMLPTDEERVKIQDAQMINPELPLGNAEQFLLTLSSISELSSRLKLWAFKLDYEVSEKEIADPLMDLKQGLESLKANKTFKAILATLLKIGIFLNGAPVKGFQIEYLSKVPEVKDTVHKHSLLHHLCHMVMETSPETSDLYSEIGPITRASKADFSDIAHNISQLENECKASWDRLKLIAKHDCAPQLKQKLVEFLADCAERIIILGIIHRRVINRYRKFLLWLGVPQHRISDSKPSEFCRIVSEFALEYRTTRERVQQQLEKKANHRERNKTRGKMIIDVVKMKTTQEDRQDAELRQILGTPTSLPSGMSFDSPDSGTFSLRRRRPESFRTPSMISRDEFTDGDDEILESLVKTATKAPGTRTQPRERKRTRNADRKSLRRTLKNGLTEEEKQHVASFVNAAAV